MNVSASEVAFAESIHAKDFRMSWRRDGFHKVLYVQRGRGELRLRNGQKVVTRPGAAGTVWLVPAGVEHQITDVVPSVILLLCAGPGWLKRIDGLAKIWSGLAGRVGLELAGSARVEGERHWRRALLEQGAGRDDAGVLRTALALQLLLLLGRQPERDGEESAEGRTRRVTREIEGAFFERWTVDEAAARAGLSRRHFTACFRRLNAESLVSFLNDRRLDHAEQLLASGRHTVTGAVFSSGFEDLAHFYRLFKRRHGCAPGAWLAHRIKEGQ
ncbi:MAG: helix-turn-helix domain-containing protein [Opitutaceae bacterium]|nr:helix-turn-helix domain-containing protein [Opitutaceae bacterium]